MPKYTEKNHPNAAIKENSPLRSCLPNTNIEHSYSGGAARKSQTRKSDSFVGLLDGAENHPKGKYPPFHTMTTIQPRLLPDELLPPAVTEVPQPYAPLVPLETFQKRRRTHETFAATPLDGMVEQAVYTYDFLQKVKADLEDWLRVLKTQLATFSIFPVSADLNITHTKTQIANIEHSLRLLKLSTTAVGAVKSLYEIGGAADNRVLRHIVATAAEGKLRLHHIENGKRQRRDIRTTLLMAIKSFSQPLKPFKLGTLVNAARKVDISLRSDDVKQAVRAMEGKELHTIGWGLKQLTSATHIEELVTYKHEG